MASVESMIVRGLIEGTSVEWKIDTGSRSTFITKDTFDNIIDKPRLEPVGGSYVTASGQKVKCYGRAIMRMTFGDHVFEQDVVVGGVRNNLIGEDFITTYRCVWDHDEASFIIKGSRVPLQESDRTLRASRVIALETVRVPSGHEAVIRSGLTNRRNGHLVSNSLGILTPERPFMERHGLAIARTLVDAANDIVYTRVYNPGPLDVQVYKHTHMALFTPASRIGPTLDLRRSGREDGFGVLEIGETDVGNMPEHVVPVFEKGCKHLNEKEKTELKKFLCLNEACFARPGEVGRTNMGTHKIQLKDDKPIREPPRRIPLYKRKALQEEVKKLEKNGLIEKSMSPWSSQTVMVQKKDGSWRMCVDYRKLNEKTIKDAYPLTRIDENLDALEGSKYYSSLDLDMAYHQVPLEEADKEKTAFATPRGGLFHFKTMPFGLCNAAGTFSRIIERTLEGLQWEVAVLYLDDIVVIGKSFEHHLANLQKVFDRLSSANLKLKAKKCNLLQKEISFLGYSVSEAGVKTDPAKVAAVKEMQRPASVTQVRSFLGLASYYRKFVEGFSKIAKPLFDLTRKERVFHWDENCEKSFKELKDRLVTAPILAFPRANGSEFILDTDASAYAIGAVLSQVQDNKERVIAYGSRCLDKAERNYCVTRREMLAVVFFTKYFKHYLLGRKFLLRTDHGSLSWLQKFREPDGQIHRWIQQLSQFYMEIQHRPGQRHGNADAMSRLITSEGEMCKQCKMPWDYTYEGPTKIEATNIREEHSKAVDVLSDGSDSDRDEVGDDVQRGPLRDLDSDLGQGPVGQNESPPGVGRRLRRGRKPNRPRQATQKPKPTLELDNLELLRSVQEKDETLGKILKMKLEGKDKPGIGDMSSRSRDFKFYVARWELLEVKNNVLCMKWSDSISRATLKICLPTRLSDSVLWYLHDSVLGGHQGIKKTYGKARLSPFFWKDIHKTVKDYVSRCDICGEKKNPPFKKRHELQSYLVGEPFQRVATDIAGPFPTSNNGNRYILVVGDYFTKLTEMYAIRDTQAETIADVIFRAWVKRFGCPAELHSDQGRQYESQLFQELCKLLDIHKTRTTPLHPRSDGMIERMNKTVNDILSKYVKVHQKDWDNYLDYIMMVYNSTPHESTGMTPHRMVYGEEMRFPIDFITEKLNIEGRERTFVTEYVANLEDRLSEAHKIARLNLGISAERQKLIYDAGVKSKRYSVGDMVWRNQKKNVVGRKSKIARHWSGPWVICEKLSDVLFKIKFSRNSTPVVVHGDNLKPYSGDKKFDWFNLELENTSENEVMEFPELDHFVGKFTEADATMLQNDETIFPTTSDDSGNANEMPEIYSGSVGDFPESGVRPRANINVSPRSSSEHAHSIQTRFGRKVSRPRHLQDFIQTITMSTQTERCHHCGKKYTCLKNLQRHLNQVHNPLVNAIRCPAAGCDRIFLRREYLRIHIKAAHKEEYEDPVSVAKATLFQFYQREHIQGSYYVGPVHTDLGVPAPEVIDVNEESEDSRSSISSESDQGDVNDELNCNNISYESDGVGPEDDESDGEVPGPSGDARDAASGEQQEPKEIVELFTLSLVKRTVKDSNGNEKVEREHHFAMSPHYDIKNFNWRDFVRYMGFELVQHMQAMDLKERKPYGSVRVAEVDELGAESID